MTDLFIAYAHPDRENARKISSFLGSSGYSSWWDYQLIPGQSFVEVILDRLSQAKAVIVLWSKSSVSSRWVIDEARLAVDKKTYFPVIIDDKVEFTDLPAGFQHFNTLRLSSSLSYGTFKSALQQFLSTKPYVNQRNNLEDVEGRKSFISYSTDDEDIAISCVEYLENNGCSCWIAFRDVDPGEDHREQIVAAISKSRFVLCLFSCSANESFDVGIELLLARKRNKKRLFLKLDDCQPSPKFEYELAGVQWVEFSAADPEKAFSRIAQRARIL